MDAKEFFQKFLLSTKENTLLKDGISIGIDNPELEGRSYFDIYRNHEKEYTKLVNKRIIHNIISSSVD